MIVLLKPGLLPIGAASMSKAADISRNQRGPMSRTFPCLRCMVKQCREEKKNVKDELRPDANLIGALTLMPGRDFVLAASGGTDCGPEQREKYPALSRMQESEALEQCKAFDCSCKGSEKYGLAWRPMPRIQG